MFCPDCGGDNPADAMFCHHCGTDLRNLAVPNPCPKKWDEMKGDGSTRHCESCDRDVVDVTGMSKTEAIELFEESTERVCVHGRANRDGRLLFEPEDVDEEDRLSGVDRMGDIAYVPRDINPDDIDMPNERYLEREAYLYERESDDEPRISYEPRETLRFPGDSSTQMNEDFEKNHQSIEEETTVCPFCGSTMPISDLFCGVCGGTTARISYVPEFRESMLLRSKESEVEMEEALPRELFGRIERVREGESNDHVSAVETKHQTVEEETTFCHSCGSTMSVSEMFCGTCGAKQPDASLDATEIQSNPNGEGPNL